VRFTRMLSVSAVVWSFVITAQLTAQRDSPQANKQTPRYNSFDVGTLGGPQSYGGTGGAGTKVLNNQGIATGSADTPTSDPNAPNCFNPDCFVSRAYKWHKRRLVDLGVLPGGNSSTGVGINDRGWVVGASETGEIDPFTGFAALHAVLWKNGQIIDLGTLGGLESVAGAVNNRGQVVGFATNAVPDLFSGFGTQVRAFIWENGVMHDLGTLGGPDTPPFLNTPLNESGQVAGCSNTDSTPNPLTGVPTTDAFFWPGADGAMIDLGGFGGTLGLGEVGPASLNNRGQVTGSSYLEGDLTAHPFLWPGNDGKMMDLGTLGGDNGFANWINDAGKVAGFADLPGSEIHHAFLWRKGTMHDLGTLGANSAAFAVNSQDQVVGRSRVDDSTIDAFVWSKRTGMIDLNTVLSATSDLQLEEADNINDQGEIFGLGFLPNGDERAFVLIPCGDMDQHGCDDGVARDLHANSKRAFSDRVPAHATRPFLRRLANHTEQ
jgi:probable HAF family extracellular repeat protein